MFATLVRMLAMARIGVSAKRAISHGLRNAALFAFAVLLLLAGAGFGMAAAYSALRTAFEPFEAAGLMAAGLALAGVALFGVRAALNRRDARSDHKTDLGSPEGAATAINTGARDITRALGPTNVIALALLAGIAAGRTFRS